MRCGKDGGQSRPTATGVSGTGNKTPSVIPLDIPPWRRRAGGLRRGLVNEHRQKINKGVKQIEKKVLM